jgi:branched-chain amino acid aminotransferase
MDEKQHFNECNGDSFIFNGNIKPRDQFDETILVKGIALYEVVKVKGKTPLFIEEHIERLFNSCDVAGMKTVPGSTVIVENLKKLIAQNSNKSEGNIRILLHFPEKSSKMPSLYCYYIPHYYPSEEEYASGVPLIIVQAERRLVHSKIINLEFRAGIYESLKKNNAYEALLADQSGFITEGSKSNFFMIKNNMITTAPSEAVLPGITRKFIIDICTRSGIDIDERKIHSGEIDQFDSCFISGTSPGVLAVRNIGKTQFTVNHPVLVHLSKEYNILANNYIKQNRSIYNQIN